MILCIFQFIMIFIYKRKSKMNSQFFNENEENDFNLLNDFNSKLGLDKLGTAPTYHYFDASGITSTGDYVSIEIKSRNQSPIIGGISGLTTNGVAYTANTIYIEEHKLCSMLLDASVTKSIPLYVNFLNNDYVYVFNLNKLNDLPKRVNKKIWSKGYQRWEYERRYELPISEAFKYHKTEEGRWIRVYD